MSHHATANAAADSAPASSDQSSRITASETEQPHHHHHHNHHGRQMEAIDASAASSSAHTDTTAPPRSDRPHRKQSRKHSHKPRPAHHSHKGPILDPNDPTLEAPGSAERPVRDGNAEHQPLLHHNPGHRGPGGRPQMIQYGSVYYYPLSRQPTEGPYESQGRRMLLLAVIAIIIIMGVIALDVASDSHPDVHESAERLRSRVMR